ncbi:MAG: hypothetical protein PHR62_08415, partial [Paludibacter sp.]|nr:hypothetical protein [Paludibacter sp.]
MRKFTLVSSNSKKEFISFFSKIILSIVLLLITQYTFADGAIGYKGIKINKQGTYTWYKAHNVPWGYIGCDDYQFNSATDFNEQNFGTLTSTDVLQISGFAVVG